MRGLRKSAGPTGLEIVLMGVSDLTFIWDEETRKALQLLPDKELMVAGAFYTADCRATYHELKAKEVQFKSEPKEKFYGIEAIVTDGCGNRFSMTQPKAGF